MATNFFWIGYHFEEFRSQVAIREKKLISRPVLMLGCKVIQVIINLLLCRRDQIQFLVSLMLW